jgi:hypothetical protein
MARRADGLMNGRQSEPRSLMPVKAGGGLRCDLEYNSSSQGAFWVYRSQPDMIKVGRDVDWASIVYLESNLLAQKSKLTW